MPKQIKEKSSPLKFCATLMSESEVVVLESRLPNVKYFVEGVT